MKYRITKVYTKQGDKGYTRLGGGQKVRKDSTRIRAYGTVDELNSAIGVALSFGPVPEIEKALLQVQHQLFTIGGELCILEQDKSKWQIPRIRSEHISELELLIDRLNADLEPLQDFVLPGGTKAASFLHLARCTCRRAETLVVKLSQEDAVAEPVIQYLNRLSDALFVLARYENHKCNIGDVTWQKDAGNQAK